ncbi:MAG: RCC1 domain-containing protein, partial [Clostridia bacterium]
MIARIGKLLLCFVFFFTLLPLKPIEAASGIMQIAAGNYHTLVLKSDGTVWGWGGNLGGELGDGTAADHPEMSQVQGLTNVIAIATGDSSSLALKSDHTVWTWGANRFGQLGDGTIVDHKTPVQVKGPDGNGFLNDVIAIDGGTKFSVALKSDGTVWAWGDNEFGQLGNGTNVNSLFPVQVSGLSGIKEIAAGNAHTLALKEDGTVWAWGYNGLGQLGCGNNAESKVPVQVIHPDDLSKPFQGVSKIAAAGYYSVALQADGEAWAWGSNAAGQLGNGTITTSTLPVKVKDENNPENQLKGIVAIDGSAD